MEIRFSLEISLWNSQTTKDCVLRNKAFKRFANVAFRLIADNARRISSDENEVTEKKNDNMDFRIKFPNNAWQRTNSPFS